MDDKYIDKLRLEKEIDSEIQSEIEALINFANSMPQYMDDMDDIEKPSIKTDWLKKKMR